MKDEASITHGCSRSPDRPRRGFTLVELLVVVAVIALLIGVLLPALAGARLAAIKGQNSTNLRSIHQAFVIHAHDNDTWYTGINGSRRQWKAPWLGDEMIAREMSGGTPMPGTFTEARLGELISLGLLDSTEILIHPSDPDPKTPWVPGMESGDEPENFDFRFFSYALNELGWPDDDAYEDARREWNSMGNHRTPVVSDRLYAIQGGLANQWDFGKYVDMYSSRPGDIEFAVCWNDGHVKLVQSPVVKNTELGKLLNTNDNIFSRGHDSPAGNEILGDPVSRDRGCSVKMNAYEWDPIQPIAGGEFASQ